MATYYASTPCTAEDNSLATYLKSISANRALTHDEELRLALKIRRGDRKARDTLIKANLKFVVSVARNYRNQGLPLSDLINEGNLGLIKAAVKFDEKKNFKFISYAVWWIRQSILQALAAQSRITKVPLNQVGTIYKVGRAQCKLEQKLNRAPEPEEIARELNLSESKVKAAVGIGTCINHVSLDAPVSYTSDSRLMDLIQTEYHHSVDDMLTRISLRKKIEEAFGLLLPLEQEVVCLYFGIESGVACTLDEIARHFNSTREKVRQIKEQALQKLRKAASDKAYSTSETGSG